MSFNLWMNEAGILQTGLSDHPKSSTEQMYQAILGWDIKQGRNYDLIMQTPSGTPEEHSDIQVKKSFQILIHPSLCL